MTRCSTGTATTSATTAEGGPTGCLASTAGPAVDDLDFFLAGEAAAVTVDCFLALRFLTTRVLTIGFLALLVTDFSLAAGFSSSSSSLQRRTVR
jgi:hypothetical protein